MNRKCEEEKKDSRAKWLVLLLLLLLSAFGIVIGIMILYKGKHGGNDEEAVDPAKKPGGGVELMIDPYAVNGSSYGNGNAEEQGVTITGRKSMTIPAERKEVAVDFYNPKENAGLYYLTFELRLYTDDEQDYEVLYTSGLVEPGKHIEWVTLSRKLEEGTYRAVIHVQPYRMNKEKTLTNNADLKIELIVE